MSHEMTTEENISVEANHVAAMAEELSLASTQNISSESLSGENVSDSAPSAGTSADGVAADGIADGNHHKPAEKTRGGKSALSSPTALQDMFLNGLRRENIDTVIYFCDGTQERGCVRAFDTFTILLENRNSGKLQLVYKHSIARIFPTRTPTQLSLPPRPGKKS